MSEKHNSDNFKSLLSEISERFSVIDKIIEVQSWEAPAQYKAESGENLEASFIFLKRAISIDILISLKMFLMEYEFDSSVNGKRIFNLNPGYINESGLFVLTHKGNEARGRLLVGEEIWIEKQLDIVNGEFKANQNSFLEYVIEIPVFNSLLQQNVTSATHNKEESVLF